MSIGTNTRKLRTSEGLTLEALANKVGIGKSMLCQIERGTKTMSLPIAVEISKALYSRLKTFSKKSISYFPIENDWGIMVSIRLRGEIRDE